MLRQKKTINQEHKQEVKSVPKKPSKICRNACITLACMALLPIASFIAFNVAEDYRRENRIRKEYEDIYELSIKLMKQEQEAKIAEETKLIEEHGVFKAKKILRERAQKNRIEKEFDYSLDHDIEFSKMQMCHFIQEDHGNIPCTSSGSFLYKRYNCNQWKGMNLSHLSKEYKKNKFTLFMQSFLEDECKRTPADLQERMGCLKLKAQKNEQRNTKKNNPIAKKDSKNHSRNFRGR